MAELDVAAASGLVEAYGTLYVVADDETALARYGPDGTPRNISVRRALGLGLDEKAIEAVKQWKFRPGTKDGDPVTVQASIEVNFRLL